MAIFRNFLFLRMRTVELSFRSRFLLMSLLAFSFTLCNQKTNGAECQGTVTSASKNISVSSVEAINFSFSSGGRKYPSTL